jgi:hypothetical protein
MSSNSMSSQNSDSNAWILNDDDWNRAWTDGELSHADTCSSNRIVRTKLNYITSDSTMTTKPRRSSNDGDRKHHNKKFGKKRRPSSATGVTKRISHIDEDDNNTTSTASTGSMIHDDRDTTASSSSCDEFRRIPNDEAWQLDDSLDDVEEIDRVVQQYIHRCNITIIQNPSSLDVDKLPPKKTTQTEAISNETTTTFAPPKIRKNRDAKSSISRRELSSSGKKSKGNNTSAKKSVTFHKYDTVVSSSNKMEYIYSLYYNEMENEKEQDYDVVDDIESAMNDVGYFFQCLQQSISEDVTLRLEEQKHQRQRRNNYKNYKNHYNNQNSHKSYKSERSSKR